MIPALPILIHRSPTTHFFSCLLGSKYTPDPITWVQSICQKVANIMEYIIIMEYSFMEYPMSFHHPFILTHILAVQSSTVR